MTTEERIAQIAGNFGQGFQNFQQGQERQRATQLQGEARRRQEAIQAMDVAATLGQQYNKQVDPAVIQPFLQSGDLQGLSQTLQMQPDTQRAIDPMQALEMQYKQSQIDEMSRPFNESREAKKMAYASALQKQNEKSVGQKARQLSASDVARVNAGNVIPNTLQSVAQTIEKNKDIFGPISGRTASMNPYNERAQTLQSQIKASAQEFGKYMEGGVLRKEDELKYEKMFPGLSDTPEVAKNKLAIVNKLLIDRQNSDVRALRESGFDTAALDRGFVSPDLPGVLTGNRSGVNNQRITDRTGINQSNFELSKPQIIDQAMAADPVQVQGVIKSMTREQKLQYAKQRGLIK
jgi:hypothetical protein